MTQLSESSQTFLRGVSVAMQAEWCHLTELALSLDAQSVDPVGRGLATATKTGVDSIRRKLQAIKYAASLGYDAESIKEMGQERVVGDFTKSKKQKSYGDDVTIKWTIPGSLRELIQQDQQRIMAVLGLYTSTEFFDWLHALLVDLTDEQIKELAGENSEG